MMRRPILRCCFSLALSVAGFAQPFSQTLLQSFTSEKVFYKQLEIAKTIVARGDRSVLAGIEPYLTDQDRLQRANAAFLFASFGDHRGLDTLLGILYDRSSQRVIRPQGAGSYAGPPNRNPAKLLAGEIRQDRYYAVLLLGQLKAAEAVPFLAALIDDSDVNYQAAWALGEIGTPDAYEALKPFLWSDSLTRESALEALKKFKAPQ